MTTRIRTVLPGLAVVLLLALTGCGEQSPDASPARHTAAGTPTSSASPSASTSVPASGTPTAPASARPLPRCAAVWVDGKRFPGDYRGCRAGGKVVRDRPLVCESTQQLFTHGKHFWAVGGAYVVRSKGAYVDDPHYQKVHRACTA